MPKMTHMEFTKQLRDSGLSRPAQLLFAHLFERQEECMRQLDDSAKVMLALANSLQGMTELHGHLSEQINSLSSRREPGVDVSSVAYDTK